MTALVAMTVPSLAHAHLLFGGEDDHGHVMWWLYGIVLGGLCAFFIYKTLVGRHEAPEQRALRRRLGELERALNSCLRELQNADEYPVECGLSDNQRRERLDSATTIRGLIDATKLELDRA